MQQGVEPSQQNSDQLQSKIDRLEHLVLSFIGNASEAGKQSSTTTARINGVEDAEFALSPSVPDQEMGLNGASSHEVPVDDTWQDRVDRDAATMKIDADYKHSISIDEAHWAQLLNGVRVVPESYQ